MKPLPVISTIGEPPRAQPVGAVDGKQLALPDHTNEAAELLGFGQVVGVQKDSHAFLFDERQKVVAE